MENSIPLLIVEDNPVSLRIMERVLGRAGYDIVSAENGGQALDILRERIFPVVITDWEMPGMNGIEFCRRIRKEEIRGYTYIIMLTSKSSTNNIVEGFESGADQYLIKPVGPKELIARLSAAKRIHGLESCLRNRIEEAKSLPTRDSSARD